MVTIFAQNALLLDHFLFKNTHPLIKDFKELKEVEMLLEELEELEDLNHHHHCNGRAVK